MHLPILIKSCFVQNFVGTNKLLICWDEVRQIRQRINKHKKGVSNEGENVSLDLKVNEGAGSLRITAARNRFEIVFTAKTPAA